MNEWRIDSRITPYCGEYIKGKGYYNSNTGKYVTRKYEWMGIPVPKRFIRYEFEVFDDVDLIECFGLKLYERVSSFISYIYRKSFIQINSNTHIYVSNKDLSELLGENSYRGIILKLKELKHISVRSGKRSKYDANKRLMYVELNSKFFNSIKRVRYVQNRQLYNSLLRRVGNSELTKDRYIQYELEVIKCLELNPKYSKDDIVNLRLNNKLNQLRVDYQNLDLLSNRESKSVLKNLCIKGDSWVENYRKVYQSGIEREYDFFIDSLESLKLGEYEGLLFKDEFSKRMYNPLNLGFKELRKLVLLDGEPLVELDIKNSNISFLYLVLLILNDEVSIKGKGIEELRDKLGGIVNGDEFINMYRSSILEGNDDFYSEVGKALYRKEDIDSTERKYVKKLVLKGLNTNALFEKDFDKYGLDYDGFMKLVFGVKAYRFIEYIKSHNLFNTHYDGNKLSFLELHENMSKLLMRIEVIVIKILLDRLIKEGVKYINLFDGIMIKGSDVDKVMDIINEEMGVFRCIRFTTK